MTRIRQSISWWCFIPVLMSPEVLVKTAADIGYEALELVDPVHWQRIKDAGLEIASVAGHKSIENGMNRRENRERIVREVRENLELAVKWGISNLICFSGNRNGLDDVVGLETTVETLAQVASLAESASVTLILELLNSKIDHPDYQADHTAWGVEVCKRVGSPRVKLLYDIYHMQVMEGDIIKTITDFHPYIGHYHTAGVPGRHEIDDSQELNYKAIVKAIQSTGYQGYLGQEFVPQGDPRSALKEAFDICSVTE